MGIMIFYCKNSKLEKRLLLDLNPQKMLICFNFSSQTCSRYYDCHYTDGKTFSHKLLELNTVNLQDQHIHKNVQTHQIYHAISMLYYLYNV